VPPAPPPLSGATGGIYHVRNMRVPIAAYGWRELLVVGGLFGAAAVVGFLAFPVPFNVPAGLLALALLVFVVSFFRDPERPLPQDEHLVVSPADGTVADIQEFRDHPFMKGPCHRVGIFLSVFNVHVNRAPLTGRVEWLHYKPGAYLDARDPAASEENEAQDVGFRVVDAEGREHPVLVRQIAGLIARRIVCDLEEGEIRRRGERFGMIKFGSRTEIFLPVDLVEELQVRVGDKVRGGLSVIARLRTAVPDAFPEDRETAEAVAS